MKITYRETLHRSKDAMARLQGKLVVVCGTGSLGANLAESLARCGVDQLRLIDFDRVEEHNLSTQPFQLDDVGAPKAEVLAYTLYRAVGIEADYRAVKLTESNVGELLKNAHLVLDCFDNSLARRVLTEHCSNRRLPCLHTGLADGYSEVLWNHEYRVPSARQDDICDYPLARNLVTLTVSVACETVLRYLIARKKSGWTITLRDLCIQEALS